jgi:hypothetical protein
MFDTSSHFPAFARVFAPVPDAGGVDVCMTSLNAVFFRTKMRESLGWITNCPNHQTCPQNWLEYSVSEIPLSMLCHVCSERVWLVSEERDLLQKQSTSMISAYPVIPCAGNLKISSSSTNEQDASNGSLRGRMEIREPPPKMSDEAPPPPLAAANTGGITWYCTLQNGESFKLEKDTLVIGRSRTCDIVVPSAKVSRQHASVSRANGEYFLEDLGSANGVWLRGEKITRVKINPGDVFTISDETLTFDVR